MLMMAVCHQSQPSVHQQHTPSPSMLAAQHLYWTDV
jgi:hypothetical protein